MVHQYPETTDKESQNQTHEGVQRLIWFNRPIWDNSRIQGQEGSGFLALADDRGLVLLTQGQINGILHLNIPLKPRICHGFWRKTG